MLVCYTVSAGNQISLVLPIFLLKLINLCVIFYFVFNSITTKTTTTTTIITIIWQLSRARRYESSQPPRTRLHAGVAWEALPLCVCLDGGWYGQAELGLATFT